MPDLKEGNDNSEKEEEKDKIDDNKDPLVLMKESYKQQKQNCSNEQNKNNNDTMTNTMIIIEERGPNKPQFGPTCRLLPASRKELTPSEKTLWWSCMVPLGVKNPHRLRIAPV